MSVYPYKFEPVYKEKIWGGRAMERLFGRSLPEGVKIGESWELADLPEGQSVVSNGPDAGKTLNSLLTEKADEILGPDIATTDGRFPLLLKLLDANDILSLQVHPDEQAAAELGPPAKFKTECWYILESRDGYILKGVRPGLTEVDFRQAVAAEAGGAKDAFSDLLQRFDVSAGDFHYLPAGTVHALGPGVVLAEIQTPSYTTYRISDWGRGREVHVEEALKCIHFDSAASADPPGAGSDVLVASPYFTVRRLALPVGKTQPAEGECKAWMVLAGKGKIACGDLDKPVSLSAGDTVLLPAGIKESSLTVEKQMMLLEVTIPKTES